MLHAQLLPNSEQRGKKLAAEIANARAPHVCEKQGEEQVFRNKRTAMTRSVNATRRAGSLSNQTPAPKYHIIQDETDHALVFSLENIEWEFDRQQKGS